MILAVAMAVAISGTGAPLAAQSVRSPSHAAV